MMCDEVVRGEWFKATAAIHRPFADAIAARVGMDTAVDLLPNIVASTYEAAVRAAMLFWLRLECTQPYASVLRDALTVLAPVAEALERAGKQAAADQTGADRAGADRAGADRAGRRHLSKAV
jgi:hypothetical protein